MSGPVAWLVLAALVVFTAASLRFYLPLAWRVFARGGGETSTGWVGGPDAAVALVLAVWFAALGRDALAAEGDRDIEFRHILGGAMTYASVVVFIGVMVYRRISMIRAFGWQALGFGGALGRALLCLLAAYPLLLLVQAMVFGASGGEVTPQDVVEFLQSAESPRDRAAVLVMAIVVAPLAEEFIFRGYLYPVGKKYLGGFAAAMVTAALFAVLHGHTASLPALFTLALCLVLSYEKTGSLLVPMIMHAVFNAVSVAGILYLM
ncbi:MAG: CPBP family intramembrane glutamic endopeptidase [Chthoniobacterales bacterium]